MARFEIIAGVECSYKFSLLSDDGMTNIVLDPSDTGTFSLYSQGNNKKEVLKDIPMQITDYGNGEFTLILGPTETMNLVERVGFQEDCYPTLNTYIGLAEFVLANATNRSITLNVFVRTLGE